MKRFHNKKITIPSRVVKGTIQGVRCGKSHYWIYTENELSHYTEVYAVRIDQIDLPMLDVYELKGQTPKGITVGYMLDSASQKFSSAFNYLCVYSSKLPDLKLKDLRETQSTLQLKYKLRDLMLYNMGVYGSMVTVGYNQNIKEKLEF